jgi:bifunctional UDP-N-acetylglucosamine pyrophosphorylase/glucosamine-1-phosphate N-acetyltransferase
MISMTKLKACILAAGVGHRLAPLTETRPKPLIPLVNKPLLQHMIENLRNNGITEILLIVGYRKDQIQAYFGDGKAFDITLTYIEQNEFLGTGHATNLARDFVGQDPFLLIYGDLYMEPIVYQQTIDAFQQNPSESIITAKTMPDPTKWGILQINDDEYLENIIEKPPDNRYGRLANAGLYIFRPAIFEGIAQTEKSPRGEYELTDAILHARKSGEGEKFRIIDATGYYWSDVGHPWQLLETTQHIMSRMPGDAVTKHHLPPAKIINHDGVIEDFVTVHGTLEIGKGSIIKSGSYIEGPVIIGENCVIGPNAYLRPFSVLGDRVKVGNGSEIKASILFDSCAVPHLSYIGDSIIGEAVNVGCGTITANLRLDKQEIAMTIRETKVPTHRKKLGTVIGDHASLGIQVSIMPGKTIGSFAQIGSHTVITENIPSQALHYAQQSVGKSNLKK